jgi:predicted transcriptional regulator
MGYYRNYNIYEIKKWPPISYVTLRYYGYIRKTTEETFISMYDTDPMDQIKSQILALCQEDATSKTRIVYQTNLNFKTAKEHLDLLLEKGLLEAIPGERIMYKTTKKGERALESHKAIEAIYS